MGNVEIIVRGTERPPCAPLLYSNQSLSKQMYTELCLFSDASNWAIGQLLTQELSLKRAVAKWDL